MAYGYKDVKYFLSKFINTVDCSIRDSQLKYERGKIIYLFFEFEKSCIPQLQPMDLYG